MGDNVRMARLHEPTGIKAYGNAAARTGSALTSYGGKFGLERCSVEESDSGSLKPLAAASS